MIKAKKVLGVISKADKAGLYTAKTASNVGKSTPTDQLMDYLKRAMFVFTEPKVRTKTVGKKPKKYVRNQRTRKACAVRTRFTTKGDFNRMIGELAHPRNSKIFPLGADDFEWSKDNIAPSGFVDKDGKFHVHSYNVVR